MIKGNNPVLRGFHPDPSLIQVGEEYYLAVSTFEWYPGVRIYHSKDLVNWEYLCSPLDSYEKMDIRGCKASDGIWAPCLRYDGEYYYLVYTIVHGAREFLTMDVSNYIIKTKELCGIWDEPVYLNSSGFDPAIFIDDDKSKWILNMIWDYRKVNEGNPFGGIVLQQFDEVEKKLVGKPKMIFQGTKIGSTEGPQIFKRGGYYYLVCAEGGTGYYHAVTVARSTKIDGPYEVHPNNPVLTSWEAFWNTTKKTSSNVRNSPLKKAGHGCFCQAHTGEWYMAHLCARPIADSINCPLGRETAIQEIIWKEDWPYIKDMSQAPASSFQGIIDTNASKEEKGHCKKKVYHFNDLMFLEDFQTLRDSYQSLGMTIEERKGYLRIYGKESIFSRYQQALLARRQTELRFEAKTSFTFHPESFHHMAGLIYRYDESNQYYNYISYDEDMDSTMIYLMVVKRGKAEIIDCKKIQPGNYELCLMVRDNETSFYYVENGVRMPLGPVLETGCLSDEYADGFTGAFVGICVQDMESKSVYADFKEFSYEVLE